jgi:hypothetical protein
VEGLDLNSKAGLFFREGTGEPLRLIVNRGRLGIAGGGPLLTVSKDRFRNPRGVLSFMSQDEFELHFLSPDQFELKSMEGKTTQYRRAQPYTPTPADLQAFAGRYESDELKATFQMAPGKKGVIARLNDSPTRVTEFNPVHPDTFQLGQVTVRFLRDTTGNVVALELTNPVFRNVKFNRLNESTSRR